MLACAGSPVGVAVGAPPASPATRPVALLTFSPSTIRTGSLAAGDRRTLYLLALDAGHKPVAAADVELRLLLDRHSLAIADAFCATGGRTPLTSGEKRCRTDSRGRIRILYRVGSAIPSAAVDRIVGAHRGPLAVTATASYTYPTIAPRAIPNPIAAPGTLRARTKVAISVFGVASSAGAPIPFALLQVRVESRSRAITVVHCNKRQPFRARSGVTYPCTADQQGHVSIGYRLPKTVSPSGSTVILAWAGSGRPVAVTGYRWP